MIDCHHLSDRMPEVARGAAAWTAEEERHLTRCESCRFEWELVGRARRLGATPSFRLDEAGVTDVVLRRLRTADTAPRRRWSLWVPAGLAAAAALILLLRGRSAVERLPVAAPRESVVATVPSPRPVVAPPAPVAPPPAVQAPTVSRQPELAVSGLDDLNADDLAPVLDALNEPFDAQELLRSPGWSDQEGREFEHALGVQEG